MRLALRLLTAFAVLLLCLSGCKQPCEEAIDEIRAEVEAFLEDSDPFAAGAQPCDDDICLLAAQALDTGWPFFDCTSCDAAEIKLCGCYDDNAWMSSVEQADVAEDDPNFNRYSVITPHYPASVYCLAKYFQQRSLCACSPCAEPAVEMKVLSEGERNCTDPHERHNGSGCYPMHCETQECARNEVCIQNTCTEIPGSTLACVSPGDLGEDNRADRDEYTDANGNGEYDPEEPFDDWGTDGLRDRNEPGYDAETNPDPSGDNYDPETNPTGTEGNGLYEPGEPFDDENENGHWDQNDPDYHEVANPDPSGDDYNPDTNPTGTEDNGVWDKWEKPGNHYYLPPANDCYMRDRQSGTVIKGDNGKPVRVCALPLEPVIKHPILQQTDTCDSILASFDCSAYDADSDGVPDQYDSMDENGQDKSAQKFPENAECIYGPPSTVEWAKWFTNPRSLYDGGQILIDSDGSGEYEDADSDGVSDSCDNCWKTPNGFDCLLIPGDFSPFEICDADHNGRLDIKDLEDLSPAILSECLTVLKRKAPYILYCDRNEDGVVTLGELKQGNQLDSDGDRQGDACEGE
ncbi:MAG: hypothetical protein JXR96_25280 [Deltaproteobacteria bacterium]|nr:hypothetical protein [Deltaproteobacteria bacterium]